MRANLTIAMCGFVVAFYWASVSLMVPASALSLAGVSASIADMRRVATAMPGPEMVLGIRDTFEKIDRELRRR